MLGIGERDGVEGLAEGVCDLDGGAERGPEGVGVGAGVWADRVPGALDGSGDGATDGTGVPVPVPVPERGVGPGPEISGGEAGGTGRAGDGSGPSTR